MGEVVEVRSPPKRPNPVERVASWDRAPTPRVDPSRVAVVASLVVR